MLAEVWPVIQKGELLTPPVLLQGGQSRSGLALPFSLVPTEKINYAM